MEHAPMNARSKAAAWAWYQRGSGSAAALASARSEAAERANSTPHRSKSIQGHGPPSRFKLEADLRLLSGTADIDEASGRLECLHVPPESSTSSSSESDLFMPSPGILAMPRLINSKSPLRQPLPSSAVDLVVAMSSSSYGTASWDCGSALFDSFELVAMSKKLDDAHQLYQGVMEKVSPPVEDHMNLMGASASATGTEAAPIEAADDEGEEKEEETSTGWLPHRQSPADDHEGEEKEEETNTGWLPHRQSPTLGNNDLGDSNGGASHNCKQSRQAIYDMFCPYDEPTVSAGRSPYEDEPAIKKHSTSATVPSIRSSKLYHRRRRLQSLSKAFRHQLVQFTGQFQKPSASIAPDRQQPDEPCLRQSSSLPSPHTSYHKTACGQGSCAGVDRSKPDGLEFQAYSLRKQHSANGVHHYHHHYHHHHHHHRLRTHQSGDADGFGMLPITPLLGADKSLLVAAAGLRTSKVSSLQDYNFLLNAKLENTLLDSKHRWGEQNANNVASGMEYEAA